MTVRTTLAGGAASIAGAGGVAARRDAETLLAHVLGRDRSWLLAHPEATVEAEAAARFQALVARRTAREPLQYLLGEQEFYGLRLQVTPATLIPRPETERLVEAVIAWAKRQMETLPPGQSATSKPQAAGLRIVDVGTGTGAIALALATALPGAALVAVDLSEAALEVARGNAARLGLAAQIELVAGDLLEGYVGRADIVVSNPPYVPAGDAATMQPEVVRYEPHGALFAGDDGLAIYRRLIPQAAAVLRPGGLLAMEFGYGQRAALAALLAGWTAVRFEEDYAGIPRIVLAER